MDVRPVCRVRLRRKRHLNFAVRARKNRAEAHRRAARSGRRGASGWQFNRSARQDRGSVLVAPNEANRRRCLQIGWALTDRRAQLWVVETLLAVCESVAERSRVIDVRRPSGIPRLSFAARSRYSNY